MGLLQSVSGEIQRRMERERMSQWTAEQWAEAKPQIVEAFEAALHFIEKEVERSGKSHGMNVNQAAYSLSVVPQS